MNISEKKFNEFNELWLLTNPKPTKNNLGRDTLALWGIRIVIIGAMGLSGTRTGSMVAETEQLARFVGLLGIPENWYWFFDGLEALLVFLTVEVGLFVSGYFLGNEKNTDKRWYFYLMITAILPAFVSNIGPAFRLLGNNFFDFWLVVVNVIVGLSTLGMALISGKVLAVLENTFRQRYMSAVQEWEIRQRSAWYRSNQYKILRSMHSDDGTSIEQNPMDQLYSIISLNGMQITIGELVKSSGLGRKKVMQHLKTLQTERKIIIDGLNITRL